MKSIRIIVSGKVQGVYFRKYTQEEGVRLGLKGFVRNEKDGTVMIQASGEENALNDLVEWCHNGSPKSRVDGVTVEELSEESSEEFHIAYLS